MSLCNILNKNALVLPALWRDSLGRMYSCRARPKGTYWMTQFSIPTCSPSRLPEQAFIYAHASVSGIGLVPGRTILARFGARPNGSPIRPLGWRLGVPEGELNPIDKPKGPSKPNKSWCLGGASYILSKLTNHAPYSPKIRVLDYLLSEHNCQHFLRNFFSKLKLSLNRGNPASLLNSYLTKLCRLFSLFYYYLCNKKLNMEGE